MLSAKKNKVHLNKVDYSKNIIAIISGVTCLALIEFCISFVLCMQFLKYNQPPHAFLRIAIICAIYGNLKKT